MENLILQHIDKNTTLGVFLSWTSDKTKNPNVKTIKRDKNLKEVFHLYQINVNKRDQLIKFLISKNVDAKVHYPIPIHLQKAARFLKYKVGDFPNAERIAKFTLSLPVHEFISKKDILYTSMLINKFYKL